MTKVASEASVRHALERIGMEDGASWLRGHLDDTVRPLLSEPWVLDCDTTIKALYGHQEGAVVSYNPKKPGRPSHAYHAFLMASTRLVCAVIMTAMIATAPVRKFIFIPQFRQHGSAAALRRDKRLSQIVRLL